MHLIMSMISTVIPSIGVRVNAPIYAEIATVTAVDVDADASPIHYHIENTTFFRPRSVGLLSLKHYDGTYRSLNEQILITYKLGLIDSTATYEHIKPQTFVSFSEHTMCIFLQH